MLANVIPYAWADDPKVEHDELRGLCDALAGIERALGLKLYQRPSSTLLKAISTAQTPKELRELLRQIDPKILAECGIV